MSGTVSMWQKYWQVQLDPQRQSPSILQVNQRRYDQYQVTIQNAIAAEAAAQSSTQ